RSLGKRRGIIHVKHPILLALLHRLLHTGHFIPRIHKAYIAKVIITAFGQHLQVFKASAFLKHGWYGKDGNICRLSQFLRGQLRSQKSREVFTHRKRQGRYDTIGPEDNAGVGSTARDKNGMYSWRLRITTQEVYNHNT